MQYSLSLDLVEKQQRVNGFLTEQLQGHKNANSPLFDAMNYAVLLGGKRVRPFLVYSTGQLLGVPLENLDHSAAAIESIHAYSLVHDDLPAMDNDDLRRGNPTCHIAFDEATAILAGDALQTFAFELFTAILAGDALQTFAFELLAQDSFLTAQQKISQIQTLAFASGAKGMCLGQSLDLEAENKAVSLESLEHIHSNKTGALINGF